MKLSEIGEFGFIREIIARNLDYDLSSAIGIGDDCAVIPGAEGEKQIVTTDMLIEKTHFLLEKTGAEELGYKSLAVNLSDIAAMGGNPHSAYISLGIPDYVTVEWLRGFYAGMQSLAKKSGTLILGGDTTRSKTGLVINIAVLGNVAAKNIKLRSDAQIDDIICVTDYLGNSAGGLKLLLSGAVCSQEYARELLSAHNMPRPHLEEGQWLGNYAEVHAMIDVSDGIDSDLRRIMEQSEVGAQIDLEALPISPALEAAQAEYSWDKLALAAAGGEDYCLLCTIKPDSYASLKASFRAEFGHELYGIGRITNSPDLEYQIRGKATTLGERGYDHFRGEKK